MTNSKHTKLLIIGSGPAGCTAAIYGARANLQPIMIAGDAPGGQLTITTDVENYPGFADAIQGPWLMQQMDMQAKNVGTDIIYDFVTYVDFNSRPFRAKDSQHNEYTADTVIIATGATAKWLGLASEEKFKGYGVSGCATCDGFFFKNQDVIVVGGGNSAIEEALFLTNFARSVTVVHRRNSFRGEKILQDRLFSNKKISVIWDSVIDEILGTTDPKGVTGARIKNVKTGDLTLLNATGVFIAIGHTPNTTLFKNIITTDNDGYIVTQAGTANTNIPGIFACGDVQDKIYRQAVTAAGSGCIAALDAEKYLAKNS